MVSSSTPAMVTPAELADSFHRDRMVDLGDFVFILMHQVVIYMTSLSPRADSLRS